MRDVVSEEIAAIAKDAPARDEGRSDSYAIYFRRQYLVGFLNFRPSSLPLCGPAMNQCNPNPTVAVLPGRFEVPAQH